MSDYEYINELKRLKRAYELNPDNPFLAAEYANQLMLIMKRIYDRNTGNLKEMAAYRTLLRPLTEVYKRHPNNKMVAENYLAGICYIPEYLDENAGRKMLEITNQFPNNHTVTFCAGGLFFLVFAYVTQKDLVRAERAVRCFEELYRRHPSNEDIAGTYAQALQGLATIQNFFEGRKTLSKLKELANQYPYNRKITTAYENIKNIFKTGNFFALLDNKNKYNAPLNEDKSYFDDTNPSEYDESIYNDTNDNYDYYCDNHDDSEENDDD